MNDKTYFEAIKQDYTIDDLALFLSFMISLPQSNSDESGLEVTVSKEMVDACRTLLNAPAGDITANIVYVEDEDEIQS